jgi:SAM-dependent methyltransferase
MKIPWYLKIVVKIILSRMPVSYRKWSQLGFFKLGKMADVDYAFKIFFLHMERVFKGSPVKNSVFLEMGSGDSVASALLAYSVGVQKTYLIDAGDFATRDMRFYRKLGDRLKKHGLNPPEIPEDMTFENLLKACNAQYLTDGLASWKSIAENSVDFSWSHSTLEHIRKREFKNVMGNLYRVMTPEGVTSYNIDLMDHLGGRLNNLRFSEKVWESDWMAKSGFYTNRLRHSEILDLFREAGFIVKNPREGRWKTLPTPRSSLTQPFCKMSDNDLLVRTMSGELYKSALQ